MKKTLIVLCSAMALVGCDQNRGGAGSDNNRGTGLGSSRDTTYPSSRSDTNSLNSPSSGIVTNTNTATPSSDYGTQPKN
jgi:hypothetical protein